jgi:hypothetical protein
VSRRDDRQEAFIQALGLTKRVTERGRRGKPTCADCFFHRKQLCALDLDSPCSTFRPYSPEGLQPPRQPALLVRTA